MSDQLTPEEKACKLIDARLAESGWVVQSRGEINLSAGQGVAIREFPLKSGHGYADCLLFVDGQTVGVLVARKMGFLLGGVDMQLQRTPRACPPTWMPRSAELKPDRDLLERRYERFRRAG